MTDGASKEDRQLVDEIRDGDEQAFLRLVERYHPLLRRLAHVYVGSAAAAEDLVEQTWVNVLGDIGCFDGRSTLRTWVCRRLVELARASRCELDGLASPGVAVEPWRFRSDGHWQIPPRSFSDVLEGGPPSDTVLARAKASLEALPPAEREVVTLRDVEGWTAGEVCGLLAIGEAQQRALLQRGRSTVCVDLEQHMAQACLATAAT
jgi:RNA polymerase sigma-70 factor (ECF subfamily)